MAKKPRKVYGRLKINNGEATYKLEMHKDGVHVRQARHRLVMVVPFGYIINVAKKQTEFTL